MRNVIVVGAGVSGLTCAVRLLESGFFATVLTREEPLETTSGVAAALWFPFRAYPLKKVIPWSLASLERFRRFEAQPESGVVSRSVRELYRDEAPAPEWRAGIPGYRRLSGPEIPEAFRAGFEMEVPVVDTSVYLPFLVGWIERLGGRIETREVGDLATLLSETDLVVNCTGTGARSLVGDDSVFPIRGQVLRVPRRSFEQVLVDEGSAEAAYVVPRTHDCILGTTIEEEVWDRSPSEESTRAILERCTQLDPRVAGVEILEARAGLRPGRPEVRLEVERVGRLTVVHNYGHGGSGFTLSWGCADEVLGLIDAHSRQRTR